MLPSGVRISPARGVVPIKRADRVFGYRANRTQLLRLRARLARLQPGSFIVTMHPGDAIDLEHLRRYTAGDTKLEAEVFTLFREQCELWMRTLEPKGDAESWRAGAHALKGTARGIGAFAFAEACAAAEALAGEAGTPVARSIALVDMRTAMHAALTAISALEHRAECDQRKPPRAAEG